MQCIVTLRNLASKNINDKNAASINSTTKKNHASKK